MKKTIKMTSISIKSGSSTIRPSTHPHFLLIILVKRSVARLFKIGLLQIMSLTIPATKDQASQHLLPEGYLNKL